MSAPARIVVPAAIDVAVVLAFAVAGRASHDEALTLPGVWATAWPFLAALLIGWVVVLAWRRPVAPWRTGLPLWVITLAGGMVLRTISGQGTAVAFILVAAGFLLVTLVGWRVLAQVFGRRAGGSGGGRAEASSDLSQADSTE